MNEIKIGNQIWASEDLKATHFRNGDSIPFINNHADWVNTNTSAYCYGADSNSFLYTFWVIVDERNVAPVGWRVPTESDWDELISFIGHKDISGYKLKSESGWVDFGVSPITGENEVYNFNGINEFGFNGIPVGFKPMIGDYIPHLLCAYFLPESIDMDLAKYIFLFSGDELAKGGMWKKNGFPIRLIKDN